MTTIVLKLSKTPVVQKIDFSNNVVTLMTDNPDFLTPDPPLADLTAAADDTHTANQEVLAAKAISKQKTAILHDKVVVLNNVLRKMANYVENQADGNVAKINGAGFSVKDEKTPVGELPPPEDFSVTYGDEAGQLDTHWDGVYGATGYILQLNVTDPLNESAWTDAGNPTQTKHTIEGLTSGSRCWLRVLAVGAAGRGAPSGVETKIVP
ncbi:fibronectin type III domain-containing protein [Bacteroidota bacterium]